MYTEIKLKSPQVTTLPTMPPTTSKSCKKCQDIYAILNAHILTEHATMTGNDGILNNVLLNMLSLMITNGNQIASTEPPHSSNNGNINRCQTVPMSVISRATDKLTSDAENMTQATFVSVATPLNSTPSFSNDISSSQAELTTRLNFQPDLLTNLFTNTALSKGDFNSTQEYRANLEPAKLLQMPSIELPFILPNPTELSSTTGLFTSDGTLTTAGLSLLLANQAKGDQGSGKSDLDVADILINKMPIPSLNKGLDSSLLQLSTLYLQQLALNQQEQERNQQLELDERQEIPITEVATSINANFTTNELANAVKFAKINQGQTSVASKATTNQGESLKQLIVRHRQISGLIEAMSKKHKNQEKAMYKTDMQATIQTTPGYAISQNVTETHLPSIAVVSRTIGESKTIPVSILPTVSTALHDLPSSAYVTSSASKTMTPGRLVIAAGSVSETDDLNVRKSIPVVLENATTENLLNFLRIQNKVVNSATSEIQFVKQKSPVRDEDYIPVLSSESASDGELESGRKRKYSSVTMVPMSQYDPNNPNIEPLPSRVVPETKVLYKCDVCSVTFSVLATLQAHMRTHVSDKTQTCNYCQLSFTDQDKYFEHIASHRGEENVHRCQFCPKIFTSKGDYNKHITKHTQKRPYLCAHCQKAFRDPGSLTKHERIHTGEQPYVCSVCGRGFAEKSSLRKHLRIHSGEKPYKCDQCDKSFSISGNLQRHIFIHTGQRPFKCTQCPKAFNNPSHLRRHIKNLHDRSMLNENTSTLVAPRTIEISAVQIENEHA